MFKLVRNSSHSAVSWRDGDKKWQKWCFRNYGYWLFLPSNQCGGNHSTAFPNSMPSTPTQCDQKVEREKKFPQLIIVALRVRREDKSLTTWAFSAYAGKECHSTLFYCLVFFLIVPRVAREIRHIKSAGRWRNLIRRRLRVRKWSDLNDWKVDETRFARSLSIKQISEYNKNERGHSLAVVWFCQLRQLIWMNGMQHGKFFSRCLSAARRTSKKLCTLQVAVASVFFRFHFHIAFTAPWQCLHAKQCQFSLR